eukprot:gene11515-15425_t
MRYLFFNICSSYCGLTLFLLGFFLTRRELTISPSANIHTNQEVDIIKFINNQNQEVNNVNVSQLFNYIHHNSQSNTSFHRTSQSLSGEIIDKVTQDNDVSNSILINKIVIIIIDALRLDFMVQNDNFNQSNSKSSYNKFPHMHDLLINKPSQCTLFGLYADPPTVTSQRLKGLTTGTLPTFVDISSNFNSPNIKEDNIIDQWMNKLDKNHRFVVMGDDTWGLLFPSQFQRKFLFDSFNTHDINTVDNGILQHLWEEFKCLHYNITNNNGNDNNVNNNDSNNNKNNCDYKNNSNNINNNDSNNDNNNKIENCWDLFIAHFLGVDHIGHTYSAHAYPIMADRLMEMDEIIYNVTLHLPDDTLLLVFGDHGMTDQGEHGGASDDETLSGLFVYSNQNIFHLKNTINNKNNNMMMRWNDSIGDFSFSTIENIRRNPRIISQIDLVPTLSILLNITIPFSSLGVIIPELMFERKDDNYDLKSDEGLYDDMLAKRFLINSAQIWNYYRMYFEYSGVMDMDTISISNSILKTCPENDLNHEHWVVFYFLQSLSIMVVMIDAMNKIPHQ